MPALAVVLASYALCLGGTEKSLVNHALALDRRRVEPRVVGVFRGGPRAGDLDAAGIRVDVADSDPTRLTRLLAGADIVHIYRPGGAEPLVPAAARAAGVPVLLETNVFGQRDPTPDSAQFACHLFMSQMCAMRYRRSTGLEPSAFFARHRVLYNPLDLARLRALALEPREARRRLGLDPDRPVVARLGRADDRKWGPIVIDMLPELLRRVPELQVLIVGATPAKRARLERLGLLDRVRLEKPTDDEARLASMYSAADVLVTASSIGESFGVVIAEAMALGVPVVTNSTPWVDNAQVEVVDPGVTGFIANHPRSFAEATATLLSDPARRRAFGAAAAEKASRQWDVGILTRRLEDLYESLARDGAPTPSWWPDAEDLARFEQEYPARRAAQFRPLRPVERVSAWGVQFGERLGWLAGDLRGAPRERLVALAAMLRDRAQRELGRG